MSKLGQINDENDEEINVNLIRNWHELMTLWWIILLDQWN